MIPFVWLIFIFSFTASQAQSAQNKMEGGQSELSRANFLLLEAFEEDEAGNMEEAIEHYTNAVQLCLEAVSGNTSYDFCLFIDVFFS